MIFKQYTLNGKRRISNGKRHVIQRKQTRENVCGLCLNANSCILPMACFSNCSRVRPCLFQFMAPKDVYNKIVFKHAFYTPTRPHVFHYAINQPASPKVLTEAPAPQQIGILMSLL